MSDLKVLLISTYETGRQPFGCLARGVAARCRLPHLFAGPFATVVDEQRSPGSNCAAKGRCANSSAARLKSPCSNSHQGFVPTPKRLSSRLTGVQSKSAQVSGGVSS